MSQAFYVYALSDTASTAASEDGNQDFRLTFKRFQAASRDWDLPGIVELEIDAQIADSNIPAEFLIDVASGG